jgi:serine/threonine protein kinase
VVAESPNAETTFAIVLGASEFPRSPGCSLNSPKFKEAARRFRSYLETRLHLPSDHISDLFDREEDREAVCQTITSFLKQKDIRDLVVYYVGHGDSTEKTYCLFLRRTDPEQLLNTSLPVPTLKEALGGDVLGWRLHFIVDACYAARASDVFQSSGANSSSELLLRNLPEKGISFLCSSNRDHRSLTPEDAELPMFTGALLDVLEKTGDEHSGPRLSTQQVCELTKELIAIRHPEKARWPEIFPLRHREKDMPVTAVPFYPNPACPITDLAWEVRKLWERQDCSAALAMLDEKILRQEAALTPADLIECLKLLGATHRPLGVLAMFFGLSHPNEKVRDAAHRAIIQHEWPTVAGDALARVKQGDGRAAEIILDGLYASKTRQNEVDLLNQLATLVPSSLRSRARQYLGEKELRLTDESIRALFETSGEHYRIKESLGPGVLTNTYLAVDTDESDGSHEVEVVLRILHESYARNVKLREQFVKRGRQTKIAGHTNLVRTYQVLPSDVSGLCYTVHQFAGKYTLRHALAKRKKKDPGTAQHSPDQILVILETLTLALMPFHQQAQTCHCGVRPGNIFLRDVYPDIVLGDPSSILGPDFMSLVNIGLKEDERFLEYARYTAPEVFRGNAPLSADFYSLGCVAYELCCGEPPFIADTWVDLFLHHTTASADPPSRRMTRVWDSPFGPEGDAVILRLLAKKPEDRYTDIPSVLRALGSLRKDRPPGGSRGSADEPDGPSDIGPNPEPAGPHSLSLSSVIGSPPVVPNEPGAVFDVVQEMLEERGRRLLMPTVETSSVDPVTMAPVLARSLVNLAEDPETTGPALFGSALDSQHRPKTIGRYEIKDMLGRGGMGQVFLAFDPQLHRELALKVLTRWAAGSDMSQRFLREARVLAQFQHPNICPIFDVGEHEGNVYFAMPVIRHTLAERLGHEQTMPVREAVQLAKAVAAAVGTLHKAGIVHRDLKPSNILINEQGDPFVADFGLAHLSARFESSSITTEGMVLGTPAYMSPEQASGNAITAGTDIYSLGCILFEMLTGQRPFNNGNLHELLVAIQGADTPKIRDLRPDLPRDLEAICLKCLEKDPTRRYSTSQDLAADLDRFLEGKPVMARPTGFLSRLWNSFGMRR